MVVTSTIGLINITLMECHTHTGRKAFLSGVSQFWGVPVVSQDTKVDFSQFCLLRDTENWSDWRVQVTHRED